MMDIEKNRHWTAGENHSIHKPPLHTQLGRLHKPHISDLLNQFSVNQIKVFLSQKL